MRRCTKCLLLFCLITVFPAYATKLEEAVVKEVIDGDTIKVTMASSHKTVTISVLGIECPESRENIKCKQDEKAGRKSCDWQIPHGLRAANEAGKLLNHQPVKVQCGKECRVGGFRRPLRYVSMKDGRDFGLEMIRRGLCRESGWKLNHDRVNEYQKAQNKAKATRVGIWEK